MKLPIALTIAGSDSGGGAGIQADLKTFAALGVHGACAITAITAQNTLTVSDILELPPDLVRAQIERVVEDLGVDAAKTGMLAGVAIIGTVAVAVEAHAIRLLVVDPVMVAKGGARLLNEDAVEALLSRLLPLATIVTPNLPEAEVLLGRPVSTLVERRRAARDLHDLGPHCVVVKGGHAGGDPIDVFFDGDRLVDLPARRIATTNTHGSGCAFSAAITAGLANHMDLLAAVEQAKEFITLAIENSLDIGHGHGPVNPAFASTRTLRA